MLNLKCRTEYSFRTAYGRSEQVLDAGGVGICDRNSTWGHVQFMKEAKKKGVKPAFGVELAVVRDATLKEKQPLNWMSFIARDNAGLRRVYELTSLATEQTYYVPRIDYDTLYDIEDNVIVLSGTLPELGLLPRKKNIFIEMSPNSSKRLFDFAAQKNFRTVATSDNFYPRIEDRRVYEVLVGNNRESRTTPMHLLQEYEWLEQLPFCDRSSIDLADELYNECNAILPTARMVQYESEKSLRQLCEEGAAKRRISLADETYRARLERELLLIAEKQFEDYFFVIADMVAYAKRHMLVGPARGSSCGSLVCYLLGITDIDPLPYDLLFERFIDITRKDLPDIDIDFQDDRRESVFEYLRGKYGAEKVGRLGTVSRYKAKSTIGDVSKELAIPAWEVNDLKGAIIERSGGDSRAKFCILDTFETLDVGRKTLEKFPELRIAADIEGHARHAGQHAAGVLVTAEPITNYCSVDRKSGTTMIDKKDAEDLNLLKIDALGLTTLSVIQDCLDSVGWTREQLLNHPTNDEKAINVIRAGRFSGIFQFEGFALQSVCRQMPVKEFNDIVAVTALARPGPLTSGQTSEYIKRKLGVKEPFYYNDTYRSITGSTYGVVVYQEQTMQIAREIGKLSWEDVSLLRKALSKSLGREYFDQFKERFIDGAKSEMDSKLATEIWDSICTMGSWQYNKSHAVCYGLVSYWCCVMKAHFPLEFAAACLRHAHIQEKAVQILRDLVKEGYEYKTVDSEKSGRNWAAIDGKLVGGLLNIKGVGPKVADDIIKRRAAGVELTTRQKSLLANPATPYDNVFEAHNLFQHIYDDPEKHNINTELVEIEDIHDSSDREYTFIGKLITKNLRDLNEAINVQKRGGKLLEKNTEMLNFEVEDDTGKIRCTVDRFRYPKLGKPIVEEGRIGDWYIWKGTVSKGFLQVRISKWRKLK
jgi:DNA-directed DNA polymerase III PolC